MNPKTTMGLVAALAVAVLGVWWAQSTSQTETKKKSPGPKPLIDPALGELAGFEIKSGSAPALVFEIVDDKWRMTAPVSGPSEHWIVNTDASKIKDLKYVRAYAKDDPDRPTPEMTSLDSPPKIAKLTDKKGASRVVKIGKRQALAAKTYVQLEGDETLYLVDADLNQDLHKGLTEYRGKRVSEFKQNEAVRIEVTGEKHYTLVKTGGKWTLESPVKGRVDVGRVNTILRSLAGLRADKFIEDAPKGLRPYGLDPPRLVVAVTTETKNKKPPRPPPASAPAEPEYEIETWSVRVAFGGGTDKEVFAKLADESSPAVFQVTGSLPAQVAPSLDDLRDKKITAANTRRAQRIVASTQSGSVELAKSDEGWRIAPQAEGGEPTSAEFAAVDDLLKAVRGLSAIGFESAELPSHGFAQPRATIELTVEGQVEPVRLVVGGLTPSETGAYVRNEGEGFIAVVKAQAAQDLVMEPMAFLSREVTKFARGRAGRIELLQEGQTRAVVREGGTWRFTSPVTGKAEAGAVNSILSDLSNLRGRRVVGLAGSQRQFGLDAPTIRATVTVEAPPKQKPATTQPASQPAADIQEPPEPPTLHTVLVARRGDKVYAMAAGGRTICEVDEKVLSDLEAELLDRKVIRIEPSQARRLVYDGVSSFAFEKTGDAWKLAGEPTFATDQSQIQDVLNAMRDLAAQRYVRYSAADGAEFGLDNPEVSVRVETEYGETVTLLISTGGPDGGGRYASVSSEPGRVFVVQPDDVEKLSRRAAEFQKAG